MCTTYLLWHWNFCQFFFVLIKQKCILQWLPSLHTYVEFTSFLQINFHGPVSSSVPHNVPDSTISGINISEKLYDIYIKDKLFHFHIEKVEEYQKKHWGNPQSVGVHLSHVKIRLTHFLSKISETLQNMDPEISLPTMAAPPQLSHKHDYAKKKYGRAVINTLKDWLTEVLQVLQKENICDRQQY